jgi:copper ion binding protein
MAEHIRFPIEGMTCTSCVARITRSVRKVAGVESVKVDLATDSAAVAYDPARTSLIAIGEAVERAGYEARLSDAEPWVVLHRRGWLARLGL